jgi:hypothetical protein
MGLGGLELVAKVLVGAGAWLGVELLGSERAATSLAAQGAQALIVLLAGVAMMLLAVFSDACRAEVLRLPRPRLRVCFESAGARLWQDGLALSGGWLLAFGAGVLGVAGAARVSEVLDVGRAGAWRVMLVFLLHQALIAALCWIQALWIRRVTQLNTDSPRARR